MKYNPLLISFIIALIIINQGKCQVEIETLPYKIYPEVNDKQPDLPSPFTGSDNNVYVIAVTRESKYAIMPVTLSNEHKICNQLVVDTADFPTLASTGLHSEIELDQTQKITDRSLTEITELGKPGNLSGGGFLGVNENILPVIKSDNQTVKSLGLTHPEMATPLFQILNMMDTDLNIGLWNMAKHRWDNIIYFFYNGKKVFVEAYDTKGGQLSIFNDGIQGAFYIKIWIEPDESELKFLKDKYPDLTHEEFSQFTILLCNMLTGEMEPQYIMRYGFYEGHTEWRTDPVAIAFIFGLRSLESIERALPGQLYILLSKEF